MKAKSFDEYLKKRLDKNEVAEIRKQAKLEVAALKSLQQDVSAVIENYMREESVGFNELVRRLDVSPAQVNKIRKGEANLTLASIAHIFALLKRRPRIVAE